MTNKAFDEIQRRGLRDVQDRWEPLFTASAVASRTFDRARFGILPCPSEEPHETKLLALERTVDFVRAVSRKAVEHLVELEDFRLSRSLEFRRSAKVIAMDWAIALSEAEACLELEPLPGSRSSIMSASQAAEIAAGESRRAEADHAACDLVTKCGMSARHVHDLCDTQWDRMEPFASSVVRHVVTGVEVGPWATEAAAAVLDAVCDDAEYAAHRALADLYVAGLDEEEIDDFEMSDETAHALG